MTWIIGSLLLGVLAVGALGVLAARVTPWELRITNVPSGQAPLWVRQKWVGLVLPLTQFGPGPRSLAARGVLTQRQGMLKQMVRLLTGKLTRKSGYVVNSKTAIERLSKTSPEAAQWWKDNTPQFLHPRSYFLFDAACGVVTKRQRIVPSASEKSTDQIFLGR